MKTRIVVAIGLAVFATAAVFAGGGKEAGERVSADQAFEAVTSGTAFLIDVRDPASYADGHIAGAFNVPLGVVADAASDLKSDGRTIIAYCSCPAEESSLAAAQDLVAAGVTDVLVLDGGIAAWANAGYPLKRGPRP